MNFCPKCGKKGIKGTFCGSCSKEMGSFGHDAFKDIKVTMCTQCHSIFHKGYWRKSKNIKESIIKVVKEILKQNASILIKPLIEPGFIINPGQKKDIEIEINEEYVIPATIEGTYCNGCSKIGTKYFEGVLQLRKYNDDTIDFVRKQLWLLESKKTHVTKIIDIPEKKSADLYFTSQTSLRDVAQKLQKRFGGTIKLSNRLFGSDSMTSKMLYRVNALYEPFGFACGDVIAFEGKLMKVTQLGKLPSSINLVSGKKEKFHPPKEYKIIPKEEVAVCKTHPHIEVMDPKTFEMLKLEGGDGFQVNQKIKIVKFKGKAYLV